MTLNLSVIKTPAGVQLDVDQRSFTAAGCVIGRGAGNDWVLDDPERFLSSKHCKFECDGGHYYLVDLSTNGTYLNGSNESVGRGNRVALNSGDQIDVGDYRFKIIVNESLGATGPSPFDESELSKTATDVDLLNPEGGVTPESMFMSSEYGGAVGDIAPDEMKVTDPLQALDNAGGRDPFSIPSSPHSAAVEPSLRAQGLNDDVSPFGSQEDSADVLNEAAQWPDAKPESSVLPDDWDQDISLLAMRKPSNFSYAMGEEDSLIAKAGDQSILSASVLTPEPAAKAPPALVRPKPTPKTKPGTKRPSASAARKPSPPPVRTPSAATETSGRALLDALGLEHHDLSEDDVAAINGTVGTMMRETLEGLMQVLRSRASIKNEFRMNVTTIQPIENNPIKFSVGLDELLETLFLKDSRAYKEPVASIQESFNTIADHQVAMIAGIRSAFEGSMKQFDPIQLEEKFKKIGKSGVIPGFSQAKYWAAYHDYYQSIINNMERSFQELFGDEFVQAYEDQLHKLSSVRKVRGKV